MKNHKLPTDVDVAILGGGLCGQLCLWALAKMHPNLRIVMIEAKADLGSFHTWSCHESDLSPAILSWFSELISASWDSHEVFFPEFSRLMPSKYLSVRSHDLRAKVLKQFSHLIFTQMEVQKIVPLEPGLKVELKNLQGQPQTLRAEGVVDCRGWKPVVTHAWQKFVGLNLELEKPHGLNHVILKDAVVPQIDGYRFFYLLPWSPTEILVEDTYYSSHPNLKMERISQEILNYVERKGWKVKSVGQQEHGALPLLTTYRPVPPLKIPALGAAGNCFHPVTGYTLPFVLGQIQAILAEETLTNRGMLKALNAHNQQLNKHKKLLCFMNEVMFETFSVAERYKILMHFYQLPEETIQRFYRGETRLSDLFQVFLTRPPIRYGQVLKLLLARERHSEVTA